jgi:hypothetical protein
MKVPSRILLALAVALLLPLSSHAQQYFTNVSVRRVVKLRILPGKSKDFYSYLNSIQKVFEAEKDAGLILDYSFMHSVNYEGPDKYDVVFVLHYKNMATFDTIADKAAPVIAKAYGTPENRAAVGKLGEESAETVSSELVREIKLKP